MRRGRRLTICAVVLALAAALYATAAASASQDPNPPWPELLPPANISDSTQPGPVPHCRRASMACLDDTISRLKGAVARFGCDHRGVFATTYLVLSEQMRSEMRSNPHLFGDPHYLETEDSVFANYYFDMLARQARGRPIPGAWQVAMDAAAHKDVNAGQDMLLGINAHVQRDMPYVVEGVWRNAERLVSARTSAQRAQVELSIETNATAWAHMMADEPTPGYRAYRDAYCRAGGAGAAQQPSLPALPALPQKR